MYACFFTFLQSGGTPETRNGLLEVQKAFREAGLDFAKQVLISGFLSSLFICFLRFILRVSCLVLCSGVIYKCLINLLYILTNTCICPIVFLLQGVAITQENSLLDKTARIEGWLARFPMFDWVGGRTSEMSAVGLLPAALQVNDFFFCLYSMVTCFIFDII